MKKTPMVVMAGLAIACVLGAPVRAQFNSCNVSLRSWLDLPAFSGPPANGNSCWGYVSSNGVEYALMGLENQIAVVRISDPDNPVIVGSVSHTPSLWADVRVYGNYAYAGNESGGGLDVINLSNVDSGVVTLVQRFTGSGLQTIHSLDINPASGHLYLAGSNLALGGAQGSIVAVSLANPAAPVIAGQWSAANGAAYTHEPHVISYTSGPYAGKEVAFCHNGGSGLRVVDVTNKANMVPMGPTVTYPGLNYCHQGWTNPTRTYLYVNDEIDDGFPPNPRTLIFNITNLASVTLVTTFTANAVATDHNLYWRDGFIYESNYKSGLRVIDAANPTSLAEVGFFDSYPDSDGFGYNGNWNNHPFFPSGTVILSDIDRGLFILDVSEALQGNLAFAYPNGRPGLVDPAGGTTVRVNVSGLGGTSPEPDTGVLYVDRGAGFEPVPMTQVSPNVYDAVFPTSDCGLEVSYYFSAETTGGAAKTDPCSAPDTVYSVLSGSGFGPAVFEDNAETLLAWTAGPNTASTGAWVRGNPVGTGFQPEDDHTPGAGVNCWYTATNPGGGAGTDDVDGGTVRLNSPAFSLSGGDAIVTYWRWFYERDSGGDDGWVAEISNNNGTSWATIEALSPYGGQWEQVQFLVSDLLPPTALMKLRFSATDGAAQGGDLVEAAIDDVVIAPLVCPQIPAATITSAVSRKANPQAPGYCDTNLLPPCSSEPHSGGVTELRITFDIPPAPDSPCGTLEQSTCGAPVYTAYSGASTSSCVVSGNALVVTFTPGLENARGYRFTVDPAVTSISGQSVKVRGLVGDVNGDGFVNATDRSTVVGAWTGGGFSCATDVNSDGSTNAVDRSVVVGAWTDAAANCGSCP